MDVHKLLETLHIAERLKDELRHCDTSKGRRESVAEHSWRIALMALFMQDEFPELDINKVIRMCLMRCGECFTGDIDVLKTAEDEAEGRPGAGQLGRVAARAVLPRACRRSVLDPR